MGSLESKPEKKRVQAKKEAQKQPRREMAGQGNTPYEVVTEGPNGQVGPESVDAAIAQRKGLFLKRQNGDVFYRRPTTVMMFRNLPSTISRPSPHARMMAMAQGKPDPLRKKEADSSTMSIEPANSPMEAEADQVADHIVAQKQKTVSAEKEKPSTELQRKPKIQRKGGEGPAKVPQNVQSGIEAKKGGGQPLPEDTREQMEDGMGADLSNVRIHDDGTSHDMNRSVNAQAFTHGNDVFFGEGKYKPGTDQGDHLLAHELTHTVQQGESQVKKQEDEKINRAEKGKTNSPKTTESPGENAKLENPAAKLPVTDISKGFKPSKEVEEYLAAQTKGKDIEIPVKIGKLAAGMIKVRQTKKPKGEIFGEYSIAKNQSIAYDGINMFNGLKSLDIFPVIAIKKGAVTRDQPLEMFYGFKIGDVVSGNAEKFIDQMKKNTEALGLIGFEVPTTTASIQNTVAGQNLVLKVSGLKAKVAGYLDAEAEFGLEGDAFTFKAGVNVDVKGLAEGSFSIERDKLGRFAGEGEIEADIANLNGKVGVKYLSTGDVQIRGSLAIESEKFSGNVSLMVADAVTADKMMRAELGLAEVEEEGKKKPDKKAPEKKTKKNQAVAIWGTVEARITPWLTGTATVGIDSKGQVTVIGKIAPPDDIVLMEQDTKKIDLFNVEAKGGYGVPFIGQVGLFASLGMFIKAGFGPLTLRNIAFEGKYSTDPSVLQNFKITGALNISAFALLGLEAEAGVFLTLLGHDIKAGVNVTAAAGIQAYAEVQPTFEYQEQNSPEGGKVGEAWLRGHFEAAAQLFLKLSGEFFVELDAPWWSPVGDERWPYPLFDIEYPLGPSMGIGGDIDWLVGSPDLPELKFSPVEFDPDKFTSDIMAEPPPKAGGGKGGEQESGGEWTSGGKGDKDGKPETKEGEGLKGKKEPKEDVSKMTDDQRFLRACELIGDVGDRAKSKPLAIVQLREKVKKIKKKYKIRSVTTKDKGETAEVTVSHKDKDNKKEPIKVKLMSAAEMMKLAMVGKSDLEAKVKGKEDPKEHNMSESDAQAIANEVAKKHYVFEDVTVAQKGDRFEYTLDLAGQTLAVAGSGVKKEKVEDGKGKEAEGGAEKGKDGSHVESQEGFSMNGASHTLTAIWEKEKLSIEMASLNPGDILSKIDREVSDREAALSGGPKPQVILDLRAMRGDIDKEIKKQQAVIQKLRKKLIADGKMHLIGPEILKEEKFLIDYVNHLFVEICRSNPNLKDFSYKFYDVSKTTDSVKNIMNKGIEKHVGAGKSGDGTSYTAYAAEYVLGWYPKQGTSNPPQLHLEKLEQAENGLKKAWVRFGELIDKSGYDEIRTEPTYVDKWGVRIAVYEKTKEALKKISDAKSNPTAFLNSSGQLASFVTEIADRKANDLPHVTAISNLYGIILGDPISVRNNH